MALFPLPIFLEILINGSWQDITSYVYNRDPITITGGKTQSVTDVQSPATMTVTLNNRDGRFSPNYTGGVYYPYLNRNTQIRLSIVNATSSSGNTYSGYRFWGKVTDWPPLSDISGKDVYVQIAPTGPLRQINTGGGKGSALTRYYQTLTGSFAPVAYWPCEEETGGDQIGAGIDGGSNMAIITGQPVFKSVSSFNGSDPIGVLNRSTWDGLTGSFGTSGDDIFVASGSFQWVASTTSGTYKIWGAGGGGGNGNTGGGGGGGGYSTGTFATTPGNQYTVTVGAGGSGGAGSQSGANAGTAGGASSFTDDSSTHTAGGGGGGGVGGGGLGGSAGTGATHNGGAGGAQGVPNPRGGGGGGGSAGTAANGNQGSASVGGSNPGGAGGAAVTGGGAGGAGGSSPQGSPVVGASPGGGGGGGPNNYQTGYGRAGASGSPGKVELTYTPTGGGTLPSNNVLRFVMFVPKHGGNNGKVLVRAFTSGTINKLDVQYRTGGNIRLFGYNSGGTQLFDSGNLSVGADNQTLMVSAELAVSGTSVAWALSAIIPGANGVVAKTSGTVASSSMGNVTEVLAGPNADITKTAIGHISVQYALIPLWQVSQALNGHEQEVGLDRFIRMCTEQAMGNITEVAEGSDHWGFESGTQSWTAANGALTQSGLLINPGIWPTEGLHSLLLTANGGGQPTATSPTGTSGQPVQAGDIVSASADVLTSASGGLSHLFIGVLFYTSGGTFISQSNSADTVVGQNEAHTLRVAPQAPATAAFFAIQVGDHNTDANATQIFIDHVRVSPQMSPQESLEYRDLLEEVKDLDQGMLKEAKTLWGLGYRTRIKLIFQSVAVTLDYSQGTISPPFAPVVDIQNVKNDITVKRKKGSKVNVTLTSGQMSVLEPPQGTGRQKKVLKAAAAADEQLLALANHLLTLGTASDERYPTITVELTRAGIKNNAVAPLMSAVAGVDIGDYVKVTNVPFWYPSNPVKQLVIGYSETIDMDEQRWIITWNCVPESPWEITATSIRRW